MTGIADFFRAHPWAFLALVGLAVAWNAVAVAWQIRKLRRAGKTVRARVPEGALFVERWTSGSSGKSLFSRLGGANNCLLVALTKERLLIRVHCPFNLFLMGSFDLEHDVPLGEIAGVQAVGAGVRVELPGRPFTLRLRDPGKFLGVWRYLKGV
jgi:hypothetical protein